MRALKILLVLVIVIVAVVALLGSVGDDTYRYERSAVIAAPPEALWNHVSSLGAVDKWSPWNEMDPNMKKSIEGTDGTVGATQRWEGNEKVGKGEQRIEEIVPNTMVRTRLKFIEPWASESDATVLLAPEGEGTKVTWVMAGENDFMGKLMGKFMDMDAMIGKDFEKGLGMLKSQAEAEYAAQPKFEIETVERPAVLYVGKRVVVAWADMKEAFGSGFGSGMAAIGKAKVEASGPPSGVYFEWNEAEKTADMIAAIPVPMTAKAKLKGSDLYEAPATKALLIEYRGGYGSMGAAHGAMDAYIKANGLTHHTNVVEEYITGQSQEPDSTKWLTNIYYFIK